jgi:alpha-mannosidase
LSKMVAASTYPKFAAGPVGKQIHSIYRDRLETFIAPGQYESKNLLSYELPLSSIHYDNN